MLTNEDDRGIRTALFAFLDALCIEFPEGVPWARINEFTYQGAGVKPLDQRGIRKVRGLSCALAFSTTPHGRSDRARYSDYVDGEGFYHYKWQGTDGDSYDNAAMRAAMTYRKPMVYFRGIRRATYWPHYPAYVIGENTEAHEFIIDTSVDHDLGVAALNSEDTRRYVEQVIKRRAHQADFRRKVMAAYGSRCAICGLAAEDLLDAAHIIRDADPDGFPLVSNGLAFCKNHHAAYDRNLIGIRRDYVIEVNIPTGVLIDDTMLKHSIQDMAGQPLRLPEELHDWPDPERLHRKYQEFQAQSAD
jgi:putative restriction endonuclease